jgi:hypothetical protein
MKNAYQVTFEDVSQNYEWEQSEETLKNRGAVLVGYTDEYYDESVTGFFRHRIYKLDGKEYITGNGWKFHDQ